MKMSIKDFLNDNQNMILVILGIISILYFILKIIDMIKRIKYAKVDNKDAPSNEECHWRHKYKKENGIFSYKCTRPFLFSWFKPKRCQNKCKYIVLKDVPQYIVSKKFYVIDIIFGFILSIAMIVISVIKNFII